MPSWRALVPSPGLECRSGPAAQGDDTRVIRNLGAIYSSHRLAGERGDCQLANRCQQSICLRMVGKSSRSDGHSLPGRHAEPIGSSPLRLCSHRNGSLMPANERRLWSCPKGGCSSRRRRNGRCTSDRQCRCRRIRRPALEMEVRPIHIHPCAARRRRLYYQTHVGWRS